VSALGRIKLSTNFHFFNAFSTLQNRVLERSCCMNEKNKNLIGLWWTCALYRFPFLHEKIIMLHGMKKKDDYINIIYHVTLYIGWPLQ